MLVKFAVIAGSASKDLGKRIARRIKAPYVEAKTRVFPDGESKITFGRIPKNSVVLVVQSTYPPVDTNLLQALSIISQARNASSKIYAVIPYMGYARQDRAISEWRSSYHVNSCKDAPGSRCKKNYCR